MSYASALHLKLLSFQRTAYEAWERDHTPLL